MNGGGGGGGDGGSRNRRILNGKKDRDDHDLLLFKELHKREKDRIANLLQPVSDEFEPNSSAGASAGNALYRIATGRKASAYEFFGDTDKNDYNWLKTPPATPLFPSLELEATNAPDFVVQREIPIVQPLSRVRFAGKPEALKGSGARPKSPNSKPNNPAGTASQIRSSMLPTETNDTAKVTKFVNHTIDPTKPASQISKNNTDSKSKPRSRGVSPLVRSTIPAQIPGFSNNTPPNLRTDRASSVTRGRPASNAITLLSTHQKTEVTPRPKRQSCSPSVTRGRKEISDQVTPSPKEKKQQIFGSKMVDKVMNARKSITEQRESNSKPKLKPKPREHENGVVNSANGTSGGAGTGTGTGTGGFGRNLSKPSLDMAIKHMNIRRDQINSRHLSFVSASSSNRV